MRNIPNLSIGAMVEKHLKNNDNEKRAHQNLIWLKDLLYEISKHYHTGEIEIRQGTITVSYTHLTLPTKA